MNALVPRVPACILASSPGLHCQAARIGRDLERAAADWDHSQDRQEAAPRGRKGAAIWDAETARSVEASGRFNACIGDLSKHRAATMEGAFAQVLAAAYLANRLAEGEASQELANEVAGELKRFLYSLKGFFLSELGDNPAPHTVKQTMSEDFDPFRPVPAQELPA